MTDPTAILREPFAAEQVGKLPRVTCRNCSQSRTKNCDSHSKSKCRDCGGYLTTAHIHLDYVGHAAVTQRLLNADPGWTWEPLALDEHGVPIIRVENGEATMWIKMTVAGVTRIGVGSAPAGSFELQKQLISDAIRNVAMRFGVALDLWSKEPLPEIIEGSHNVDPESAGEVTAAAPPPAGGPSPAPSVPGGETPATLSPEPVTPGAVEQTALAHGAAATGPDSAGGGGDTAEGQAGTLAPSPSVVTTVSNLATTQPNRQRGGSGGDHGAGQTARSGKGPHDADVAPPGVTAEDTLPAPKDEATDPYNRLAGHVANTPRLPPARVLKRAREIGKEEVGLQVLPSTFTDLARPEYAPICLALCIEYDVDEAQYVPVDQGHMHAWWSTHGGDDARKAWLSRLTSGRTDSSKELYGREVLALLEHMGKGT